MTIDIPFGGRLSSNFIKPGKKSVDWQTILLTSVQNSAIFVSSEIPNIRDLQDIYFYQEIPRESN